MIDVWCVCTGDKYRQERVSALRRMVGKNLTVPFDFKTINNDNTRRPYCSWWDKLRLFDRAERPSIYLDLDVIITGNIDYLVDYTKHHLAAPANWAQCFLTEIYGDNYVKLPHIYSYKYHCRNSLPHDAAIVCFHGKPDYWEVKHDWIDQALS